MKKSIVLLFVSTVLSGMLSASEDGSGLYVGVGIGSTAYIDSSFAQEQLNKNVTQEMVESALGAKLYGGYQINNIVGIEASYIYYGDFTANEDYTYSAQGISVAANLGYTFFTGQLRPYALLGFGYIFSDFSHENVSVDDQKLTLHIGLGLDYAPKAFGGVGFRGAYESNNFSYLVDKGTSEEKKYAQGLGILYLGCYYKF